MIIGIFGRLGKGKTLTLTYFAYLQHLRKKQVITNYPVNFPHEIIKETKRLDSAFNSFLALDEFYLWADSYDFMKKGTQFVSQILLNSRRRGNNFAYTSQDEMQIAARIRRVTDIFIYPKFYESTGICKCKVVDLNDEKTPQKLLKFKARPVFNLYSTTENLDYLRQK